jgi:hypothetical protein
MSLLVNSPAPEAGPNAWNLKSLKFFNLKEPNSGTMDCIEQDCYLVQLTEENKTITACRCDDWRFRMELNVVYRPFVAWKLVENPIDHVSN